MYLGVLQYWNRRKTTLKELANILLKLKKSKLKIIFEKNNNFLTVKNRIGSTLKAKEK